ncbi:uncharacterized protein BO66DRAFT_233870 [Aspergillus aculeatinus CBS 121060]|uniref:Uncharacterized protein n=1 Tax=Aspergillus aculeatinus CBS 121060 TaxID=1448322 RepID=A0ACD1GTD0_9EURO|nr:hypothetical protein BO66DRAFT_233870 [Aspergillus aculeatinus CBS 121060]RAH64524.1 hypothetical protein BO66DRAFT_233870 [Aspergillus aculeatinus CBS 121060]
MRFPDNLLHPRAPHYLDLYNHHTTSFIHHHHHPNTTPPSPSVSPPGALLYIALRQPTFF